MYVCILFLDRREIYSKGVKAECGVECLHMFVPDDCLKSAFTMLCEAECYRNANIGHRLHHSLLHIVYL